jgi:hypothetical protein
MRGRWFETARCGGIALVLMALWYIYLGLAGDRGNVTSSPHLGIPDCWEGAVELTVLAQRR